MRVRICASEHRERCARGCLVSVRQRARRCLAPLLEAANASPDVDMDWLRAQDESASWGHSPRACELVLPIQRSRSQTHCLQAFPRLALPSSRHANSESVRDPEP